MDLGDYIPAQGGAFCLNGVTGPDEYTVLVNNNCYTNLMAQAHLRYAATLAHDLATGRPDAYARIARKIGLGEDEPIEWRRAASRMRVPRDDALGIHAQDDTFLTLARWDFAATPESMYPLLLHFHPLVIYRYQVLKQPDVVLAQVLLGDEFALAEKKRNFDYYDALTTGDSSLSPCIQSVAAAELGYADKAHAYFMRTARTDLDDVHGNVVHGVHIAAMAGSWVTLVNGFAGLRARGEELAFAPRLPAQWSRLRFRLRVREAVLQVTLTTRQATYELLAGDALKIQHFGQRLRIAADRPTVASLEPHLECVIFDLDGVITDTAEQHFRAWERLASETGLPFDRQLNERLKGVGRMESLEIILEGAGQTASPRDKVGLADRKNAYYRELIEQIRPDDLLPGVADLLAELRSAGVRIAIASASHNVFDVVRRLGIESAVDLIVDPAVVAKGKPDPEIFLRAAETLGVRIESCVGIEDSRAGIAAIKSAGMMAVGKGSAALEADWTVSDTRSLTLAALTEAFATATRRRTGGASSVSGGA
jgi:alpha,alpha-trehalose phosphorylase